MDGGKSFDPNETLACFCGLAEAFFQNISDAIFCFKNLTIINSTKYVLESFKMRVNLWFLH